MQKTKLYYFHGYQGSPRKAQIIKSKLYEIGIDAEIHAPEIEPTREAYQWVFENTPQDGYLMGSSLGGFVAWCLCHKQSNYGFLINPALEPWVTLAQKNPEIAEWCKTIIQPKNEDTIIYAYVNLDDEVLPPNAPQVAKDKTRLVRTYESGGHRAKNIEQIASDMAKDIKHLEFYAENGPDYAPFWNELLNEDS